MADSHYWEVRVPASADTVDGLGNFLWEEGALGVVEESLPDASPILRAFFPFAIVPARLEARLLTYLGALRELGFSAAGEPSVTPLADENWALAWREHFRPLRVGSRLLVAPSWDVPASDGAITIVLDPGRAFGTGHHGTTRGCLLALDALLKQRRPRRILDVGTGTGVLAIAAARGLRHPVLASDIDREAVAIARENARLNGVAPFVECLCARGLTAHRLRERAPFDLVLANILLAPLTRLAGPMRRLLAARANVVLSGLLASQENAALAAYRPHGLKLVRRIPLGEWVTLVLSA